MSAPLAVYDVRGNATGTYYTLTTRTGGTLEACVTVKATRYGTYACLTCHSVTCRHARFVADYVTDHPETTAA